MNKNTVHSFLFVLVVMLIVSQGYCQDRVVMNDGSTYEGTIIRETESTVLIRVKRYGSLSLKKENIRDITYAGKTSPTPRPLPPTSTPLSGATPVSMTPLATSVTPSQQDIAVTPSPAPGALSQTAVTPTPTPASTPPPIKSGFDAVLFGVVKEVKIRHPGGEWIDAYEGIQLKVNDEIMTNSGKVKIKLRGRGELRLPPNSYLILKQLSPDGSTVTIEIKGGTIWNNVTPGGGLVNYKVQTPDLTAGVRGTLFKVEISEEKGSRVAVFEGTVETASETTEETVEIGELTAVVVDPQGELSDPRKVDPREREEWDHWDEWALEVHEIAVRFPIGGDAIDNLAKLHAQDMKRYERMVDEANKQILTNREAAKIEDLAKAFEDFYVDTGVIPTEEQGFNVLVEDPGIDGWNGPYYDGQIPPVDRWGNELHYIVGKSEVSGNVYGKVISNGADTIYSKGSPATDDLATFVRYYALE